MAETNSLLNCRRSNPTTSSNLVLSAKSCKSPIYRTFSFLHPIHFFQKCQNPQTFRIPQPCIATNCDCTHTVRVPLFDICIYINMYRVPPPPVGLIYHPLYWRNLHLIARTRCIASPPPPAETMTKGDDDDKRRTFPPPRQAVAAVRSRVFRRPGCRRNTRSTENTYIIATPEAVAGCSTPHNAPSPPRWIRCQPRTTHHGASVSEPLRVLRVLRDLRLLR